MDLAFIREGLSEVPDSNSDTYLLVEVHDRNNKRILCKALRYTSMLEVDPMVELTTEQYPERH